MKNPGRLDGKTAIVTGGASGIGAAIVKLFAQEGAQVVISDVQSDMGQALAAELGSTVQFVQHDIAKADQWDNLIASVEKRCGAINVLVNNGAIRGALKPIAELTEAEYRRCIEVNQIGVFFGIKAVVPAMRRAGGGSIVNTSSAQGLVGMSHQMDYCAAKFAVTGMTKAAAVELGDDNIRVNSVHPGLVKTPMSDSGLKSLGLDGAQFTLGFPIKRWSAPKELAGIYLYLASDESSFCTGAAISVDGGMTAL